jgi:hypothetical protein
MVEKTKSHFCLLSSIVNWEPPTVHPSNIDESIQGQNFGTWLHIVEHHIQSKFACAKWYLNILWSALTFC